MNTAADLTHAGHELGESRTPTLFRRVVGYLELQRGYLHVRALLARVLCAPLPRYLASGVRANVFRAVGFDVGHSTHFYEIPKVFGWGDSPQCLTIGHHCRINIGCHLELNAPITIGDHVSIGPEVMILTGTHEMGGEEHRAGPLVQQPVVIGDGVWMGARCVVLPGVTIGKGSVISAGTTVSRDVPPNTIMLGDKGMPLEKWMALTKQSAGAHQKGQ